MALIVPGGTIPIGGNSRLVSEEANRGFTYTPECLLRNRNRNRNRQLRIYVNYGRSG